MTSVCNVIEAVILELCDKAIDVMPDSKFVSMCGYELGIIEVIFKLGKFCILVRILPFHGILQLWMDSILMKCTSALPPFHLLHM